MKGRIIIKFKTGERRWKIIDISSKDIGCRRMLRCVRHGGRELMSCRNVPPMNLC